MSNIVVMSVVAVMVGAVVMAAPAEAQPDPTQLVPGALVLAQSMIVAATCAAKTVPGVGVWVWELADTIRDPPILFGYVAQYSAKSTSCNGTTPSNYMCQVQVTDGSWVLILPDGTAVAGYKGTLSAIGTGTCAPGVCPTFDGFAGALIHLEGGCI